MIEEDYSIMLCYSQLAVAFTADMNAWTIDKFEVKNGKHSLPSAEIFLQLAAGTSRDDSCSAGTYCF